MKDKILVSVFIPVYNGQKYLVETLNTIKNQTYQNIEVLLVDDSSTDGSIDILRKFKNEDLRFKIFEKQNGGMVAISWNYILPFVKGQFIFYSSQDDLFSVDLIEKLVQKQSETNADTVLPDMEYYFSNTFNNKKIIGFNGNRDVILSGKQACIESLNWTIHGFALTATHLFKNEYFPENAFDSDEYMTRKLFFKSNKVVFSGGIFFYRQDNQYAITKTFSIKNFYELNMQLLLFNFLKQNEFDDKYLIECQFYSLKKLIIHYNLLKTYDFKDQDSKFKIKNFLNDIKKDISTNCLNFKKITSLKLFAKLLLIRLFFFNKQVSNFIILIHRAFLILKVN